MALRRKAYVLVLVLCCAQQAVAGAGVSLESHEGADEQFQQAFALLKQGTTADAAGAASILASLVGLRLVPQSTADKHPSSAFSPEDSREDQGADAMEDGLPAMENSMEDDTVEPAAPAENEAAGPARVKPLMRHPGVEVDPEAHGPALRELSFLFSTGHGVAADHRLSYALLEAAAARGDPTAQGVKGFQQSLGLHPPTQGSHRSFSFGPTDSPRALLNYYFAASGNDSFSQMVMGYRHAHGLGVPQSCEAAVLYYHPVAEETIALAAVPNSLPLVERERGRLTQRSVHQQRQTREQEMMHYQWFADMGNVDAQRAVGHMLTHGNLQDPARALQYFRRAAEAGDPDALAHLGHMYANGLGVPADNETAVEYFTDAVQEAGHPSALFGLGYMHMSGYGVEKDLKKAFQFFAAAAEQHHTESTFHLGLMYLHGWGVRQDKLLALRHLSLAAKVGHPLAMYNMAMLHLGPNPALPPSCPTALDLLKRVAEKGPQAACLQDGLEAFFEGDFDKALLLYLKAAEMGMELGQANAAWMLSHGYGYDKAGAAPVAVALHQRAAAQGNVDALLSIGDSYYYGRGVPRDWQRAAQVYGEAAARRNAQALFNLGFMYEYGAGLPQDLHLAKRHYDKAITAQPDAPGAACLALLSLWVHGAWLKLAPTIAPGWIGLWDTMFLRQEPTLGFGGGMGDSSGFGFILLMARPVLRFAFGWLHSLMDLEASGRYSQGQAHQEEASQQQQQEGLGHEDSQHQGMWTDMSSWLGGENFETFALVALCLGLWAVVGRRQALRRRQLFAHHPHPPAAANSSAAAAAVPTDAAATVAAPTTGPSAATAGAPPALSISAASSQAPVQQTERLPPQIAGTSASPAGPSTAAGGATAAHHRDLGLQLGAHSSSVSRQASLTTPDAAAPTQEPIQPQSDLQKSAGLNESVAAASPDPSPSAGDVTSSAAAVTSQHDPGALEMQGGSASIDMLQQQASRDGAGLGHAASGQDILRSQGPAAEAAQAGSSTGRARAAGSSLQESGHDVQAAAPGSRSQGVASQQPFRASDAWWPNCRVKYTSEKDKRPRAPDSVIVASKWESASLSDLSQDRP
ncbi:hypothetical protein WJX74_002011 [Apatococcus lobatus]|uniref:Uncharacterized protein n=1 Tax=Apatococcus lobatus TaxID=904363 RepID=A0AAW1SBM1_9CHLO